MDKSPSSYNTSMSNLVNIGSIVVKIMALVLSHDLARLHDQSSSNFMDGNHLS